MLAPVTGPKNPLSDDAERAVPGRPTGDAGQKITPQNIPFPPH